MSVVGFGADSALLIKEHPAEKGKPDLDVSLKANPGAVLMKVEVTGTERLRGAGYWVRPDKLAFAENHPDENTWIILHYSEPAERYVFLKPVPHKTYKRHHIDIRGAREIMCIFNDEDEEVKNLAAFTKHLADLCSLSDK